MIDIKAIRKKSENGDELKRLRTHVINAINTAADNGQWRTSVLCSVGREIFWRREVFKVIIEDLKKDGFDAYERDNPITYETWLYIDWIEPYADTDSVRTKNCNTCKYLIGADKCQLWHERKVHPFDYCNLYES